MKNNPLSTYKELFALFLYKVPSDKLINNYLIDAGYATSSFIELQDFVGANTRIGLNKFSAVGIIDVVDRLWQDILDNDISKNNTENL